MDASRGIQMTVAPQGQGHPAGPLPVRCRFQFESALAARLTPRALDLPLTNRVCDARLNNVSGTHSWSAGSEP